MGLREVRPSELHAAPRAGEAGGGSIRRADWRSEAGSKSGRHRRCRTVRRRVRRRQIARGDSIHDEVAHRRVASAAGACAGTVGRARRVRHSRGADDAPRCVPGIRATAGGSANRSARSVHRGSRKPHQRAARERVQRCLLAQDVAIEVRARQLVQERVATIAPRLPAVAHAPVILPPLSSTSRALKIGVSSKKLSQMELSELATWTIRPRLMAVPGVANVAIWGQRDRQFQVLVDPDRLAVNGVSLDEVTRAAGDAAAVAAGGFVELPNQRLPVRHLSAIETPEDLARTVIHFTNGVPLRIGDVAEVVVGHPMPIGDAVINDGPGLLLIVEKQPWGNTLEVTKQVEAALEALEPGLKDVDIDPTIFRPATFIERSLQNLTHAMVLGCVLVVVILVAFLFDWRTALISLSAIPLSLLAADVVLYLRGGTLNTMVLAGLVIAVGEVVDDAIIGVENVSRRLRLNRAAGSPLSPFRVVLQASLEVRSAVVYASLIVALVFVPVFFLEGLAGTFFRPLAFSYVLAILASLLVALTVTPALCLLLLPGAAERHDDAPLTRVLK